MTTPGEDTATQDTGGAHVAEDRGTDWAAETGRRLQDNIETVFLGRSHVVRLVLTGLLSEGHVLIEDTPGVGKTTLARALARSIDCDFHRIQFTPDLLPADILGVSVWQAERGEFAFKPGPVFTNVLLADEINRTTPRTQSSLLEAMNDFQVSVDGVTRDLQRPFLVIATQNPYEYEGTYPLPESQLDRFLMRIAVGYPGRDHERDVLLSRRAGDPLDDLTPVVHRDDVVAMQQAVRTVRMEDRVLDYLQDIVEATRQRDRLAVGVSPRGALALHRASQARALLDGRDYVLPDDVKALAAPVLCHRIILRGAHGAGSRDEAAAEIEDILERVPVPA